MPGAAISKAASKVLHVPVYPWLLGVFPILHYYQENLSLVIEAEVLPTILFMLFGTSIVFIACNRWLQDIHSAAVLTSIFSIVFSLSGHVYVEVFMPRSLGVWTILMLLGLAIIANRLGKIRSRKPFVHTTPSLNLMMLALFSFQVIRLAIGMVELSRYVDVFVEFNELASDKRNVPKVPDSPTRPDIYYIVPDGYPSDSWLAATANYDNSGFSKDLEDRGFVVVRHAQSNYPITVCSLASTLNMRYYPSNPSPYSDDIYLMLETANSKVSQFLVESGYTYVQLLTNSLLPSPTADIRKYFTPQGAVDIDIDFAAISGGLFDGKPIDDANHLINRVIKHSFFRAYIDTTLLRLARSRLVSLIHRDQVIGYNDEEPAKFSKTIEEAIKVSQMREATFTIIHLLKPHQPVVFNEKGEHINWIRRPTSEEFGAQMRYINSRFLYLIDSILAASVNPPVIVFQADHASIMGNAPEDHRLTFFDVYAAYYLPPQHSVDFPKPHTTVNTFPLILNQVFHTKFELQASKLFELTQRYEDPFAQVEVTEEFLNDS